MSNIIDNTNQPRKATLAVINSITCVHPANDSGNENEIFFELQADEAGSWFRCPSYDNTYNSMKKKSTWDCGRSIWFDSSFAIKIYDYDKQDSVSEIASGFITKDEIKDGLPINITGSRGLDNVEFTISASILAK